MFRLFVLTLLLLLTCPSTQVLAKTITGKGVSISDGDTITILDSSKRQYKICLYGIDCPEKSQAFGKAAKKHTAKLTARKTAIVKAYDTDRYGRTVGAVTVNGVDVNQSLIENGFAWQYRKYCKASFCRDWLKDEQQAKSFRRGLWQDADPVRLGSGQKGRGVAITNDQRRSMNRPAGVIMVT